ncbi:CubicO group peptidase (beta-lactamase class C family) [Streptomyces sp. SAI-135]|uniref:serine hydrolase domain-containing protein n=1 Tax=unclassified Streptomyces TaxID=2593676 RepID=UPI002476C965|nr:MULTISPECIES: serine hydrolase domain-containing protein [unclassified Streptomyces]MDH6515355.1 CubicO group peptidase (beta-lactamase class C family) [Streptomyces sp. SAI-090]MDH6547568.1 CubicO group peptidase (beta-lactamase class C family) [Streptomyces sp. SAI-041]MDH6566653.1 CubicO group peptidase (beta-lactamase class C family) [Streptomyces sp. SAI-117]MDH6620559.1 CubicO group peptidase (beta-lactamase class C family) [Streptomyces sp. SAI-135]
MADIQGTYDELFSAVPNGLAALLDAGDVGGSVAVLVGGEAVVDVWGGFADAGRTVPWERDTITNVFSTTKTMTALCALILADRGDLDPDAPVARYWPEFAAAGKEKVLVRHVLSHTAGLPHWEGPVEEIYDWPAVTARLAAQAPLWEPGTAAGYHSLTQGFLVGEVVRRVTGLTVGEFLAREVTGPLGADFHIGLAAEHDHRVARTLPPPGRDEDYTAGAADPGPDATPSSGTAFRVRDANSEAWRRGQIPAASGFGNARSVALVQSALACAGTVRGVRLLSEAGAARAREEQFSGEDRVIGMTQSYGLGYGLFGTMLGWGGWGGSLVMIDPDARMVVAYATNQMREPAEDTRGLDLVMSAYDGLQGLRG